MRIHWGLVIVVLFIVTSCGNDTVYLPKPRMYPKVDYPQRHYIDFEQPYCNLSFEYPDYAEIEQDLYYFDEKPLNPCWFNINYKQFNGTLHCSFIDVKDRKHFDKLVNDAFTLVEKHNIKAQSRQEELIRNKYGVSGLYFSIGGEVATSLQFILTDTISNFLRGSLYFNAKVDSDSIAPIFEYVKRDVDHMLETFQWAEQ